MLPFGLAVALWRLERGKTQEQLARAARISRPNLSAMEKGHREVTLPTLRALAIALEVAPGTLADGIPPRKDHEARMSRSVMEQIARVAVKGGKLNDRRMADAAERLRIIIQSRLDALGQRTLPRVRRSAATAWLELSTQFPRSVVESLIQRAVERSHRP